MRSFACSKCGSIDVYIKENGTQTGLYCGDNQCLVEFVLKKDFTYE